MNGQSNRDRATRSGTLESQAVTKMRGQRKASGRPVISAPIGPVKSSRGADFVRSDKFIMVESLKDCESCISIAEHDLSMSTQTSRQLSASFNSSGPLSSPSTVSSSEIIAMPTLQYPSRLPSPQKPRKSFIAASSVPKPFKHASAKSVPSKPVVTLPDQNVLPISPNNFDSPISHQPRTISFASRLPRSRTMNALQDLKSSISRSSLKIRSMNNTGLTGFSRKTSSTTTVTPPEPSNSSKTRFPRHSLPSHDSGKTSRTCTPERPSAQITTAQPSGYWSGRFLAIHDRFSAEDLKAGIAQTSMAGDANSARPGQAPSDTQYSDLYKRTAHLPHSTTTSALKTIPAAPKVPQISEEDDRCRRVFARLNSLCSTAEARRSLHLWQQEYARKYDRACLLPEGGSMESKSLFTKFFGVKKGEKRKSTALRQPSADRASKRTVSGRLGTPSRAKRLTVF